MAPCTNLCFHCHAHCLGATACVSRDDERLTDRRHAQPLARPARLAEASERDRRRNAPHSARRAVPAGGSAEPESAHQAETLGDSLGCHVQFRIGRRPGAPKRYGNAILTPHRFSVASPQSSRRPTTTEPWLTCASTGTVARSTPIRRTSTTRLRAARFAPPDSPSAGLRRLDPRRADRGDREATSTASWDPRDESRHRQVRRSCSTPCIPRRVVPRATTYNARFGVDPGAIDHIFVRASGRAAARSMACEVIFDSWVLTACGRRTTSGSWRG
jgi:hypothetical protein